MEEEGLVVRNLIRQESVELYQQQKKKAYAIMLLVFSLLKLYTPAQVDM